MENLEAHKNSLPFPPLLPVFFKDVSWLRKELEWNLEISVVSAFWLENCMEISLEF